MAGIDWQPVRLVALDVDGTLYDPARMRRLMLGELAAHCLRHPGELPIVRILRAFRRSREELAQREAMGVADLQFELPAKQLGVSPAAVRAVVDSWIMERPLRHLRSCRFEGVDRFLDWLRSSGKMVAVLSDYPVEAKLEALELTADLVVSAVDPEVDCFKPHPAGLQRLLQLAGTGPESCLVIGDRDERDGECARRLGASYLLKSRRGSGDPRHFGDFAQLLGSEHTASGTIE